MDILSELVSLLLWLLVGWPVCFLVHELGHASMILLVTHQDVTFQFGMRGTKREFHWGRMTVLMYFEPTTFLGARYRLENGTELSRTQRFWIVLGGPLASLLFTCICGTVWWVTNTIDPWRGLAIFSLMSFLFSSIPQNYPEWQGAQAGLPNDGLQILQLLRQSR